MLTVLALLAGGLVFPAAVAHADVPETPVTSLTAPACEGSSPASELLELKGQQLVDYNAGIPVRLYNNGGVNNGQGDSTSGYPNPQCTTRYIEDVGAVSSWTYCTDDAAMTCAFLNEDGQLQNGQNGQVVSGMEPVDIADINGDRTPGHELTDDDLKIVSWIIQNDIELDPDYPVAGHLNVTDLSVASDANVQSRVLRQLLVHCVDNPTWWANYQGDGNRHNRERMIAFCDANIGDDKRAEILASMDEAAQLVATADSEVIDAGAQGEVTITTTITGVPLDLTVSGGTVTLLAGPATLSGSSLTVDADATIPATITLGVTRADAGGVSVAVAGHATTVQNMSFVQSASGNGYVICQVYAIFDAELVEALSASAAVHFGARPIPDVPEAPVIGTSLVDEADGDRVLPWYGGVAVDTVAYQNLIPGTEYTISGELMKKSDGSATGITAEVTFTPTEANGEVDLSFQVPIGYDGESLVAFEWLFEGDVAGDRDDATAEHTDIDDEAQTVTVEDAPPAEGEEELPATGGEAPLFALGLAVLLLLAGLTMPVLSRRS